jgi:hypothetical protein
MVTSGDSRRAAATTCRVAAASGNAAITARARLMPAAFSTASRVASP